MTMETRFHTCPTRFLSQASQALTEWPEQKPGRVQQVRRYKALQAPQTASKALEELAVRIGREPRGTVLARLPSVPDGSQTGCLVTPNPDQSTPWRLTYFDSLGFGVGGIGFRTKENAVLHALHEGYRDTNRNLLRECMANPGFGESPHITPH